MLSRQDGNTTCVAMTVVAMDHRVELNTEALCAVMTSWEYLYILP